MGRVKNESHINLDLIIVNYNATDLIIEALPHIYRAFGDIVSIIIIDNASMDGPEKIEQYFPQVDLVLNDLNHGFAKACNQAFNRSRAPMIMLLNPDAIPIKSEFENLFRFIHDHEEIGVVGPKILNGDGSVQGSARGFHSFWTLFAGRKGPLTRLFPLSRPVLRDLPYKSGDGLTPMPVDWVSGACMVIKRAALNDIKGFDERFFMYFEDTDLCKRMKQAGWSTFYFPTAVVTHQVGESSKSRPMHSLWWFHQSWYRYMCKHHFSQNAVLRISVAFVVGVRFALLALIRGYWTVLRRKER